MLKTEKHTTVQDTNISWGGAHQSSISVDVLTFLRSLPEFKRHSKGLGHRQGYRLGLLGDRQGNRVTQAPTGTFTSCFYRK